MTSALVNGAISLQNRPTRDPDDGKAYIEETLVFEYAYADTGLTVYIPASAEDPVYLVEVLHLVRTAFSGGTPAVDVGDGTTADKYIAASAVTEATAGNLARSIVGAKLVANALVVITLSASLSAGAGTLFLRLFRPA